MRTFSPPQCCFAHVPSLDPWVSQDPAWEPHQMYGLIGLRKLARILHKVTSPFVCFGTVSQV